MLNQAIWLDLYAVNIPRVIVIESLLGKVDDLLCYTMSNTEFSSIHLLSSVIFYLCAGLLSNWHARRPRVNREVNPLSRNCKSEKV